MTKCEQSRDRPEKQVNFEKNSVDLNRLVVVVRTQP
jgi:hypothetical protein